MPSAPGLLALSSGAQWGDRLKETEVLLDLSTQLGNAYWSLMAWSAKWKETHDGEAFVFVRKLRRRFDGRRRATSKGVDTDVSRSALYSTVHGAGRVMGRHDTKRGPALRDASGEVPGRDESTKITREMQNEWLTQVGVILRGGDVDEAPQACRRLPDVLSAHAGTIRVVHTLTPMIVVVAGREVRDPYKD